MPHWVPKGGQDTIMGAILQSAETTEDLEVANRCRLWLRVHHLYDIATVDGKRIHPGYKKGKRVRESQWKWPEWEPPKTWWKFWETLVETYLRCKFPLHKGGKSEHQQNEFFINEEGTRIKQGRHTWEVNEGTRYPTLKELRNEGEQPGGDMSLRCDVWEEGGIYRLLSV